MSARRKSLPNDASEQSGILQYPALFTNLVFPIAPVAGSVYSCGDQSNRFHISTHSEAIPNGILARRLVAWITSTLVLLHRNDELGKRLEIADRRCFVEAVRGAIADIASEASAETLWRAWMSLMFSHFTREYRYRQCDGVHMPFVNLMICNEVFEQGWDEGPASMPAGEFEAVLGWDSHFLRQATENYLDLDERVVRACGFDCLSFDLYVWWVQKTRWLEEHGIESITVPWKGLALRFAGPNEEIAGFQDRFSKARQLLSEHYEGILFQETDAVVTMTAGELVSVRPRQAVRGKRRRSPAKTAAIAAG